MWIDRVREAARIMGIAGLVCLVALLSSCSTVNTFLSNLDLPSLSGDRGDTDRKIPLPPMAEDYGATDREPPPAVDGTR